MSSLMVSNDLDIMMLEFAVEKLFIPKNSVFDTVVMKKTTVMFRMLDSDWIAVNPHRTDYAPYKGSNLDEVDFHGGKSVVFAIPSDSLEIKMKDIDIQIHVIKELSKYFEVNPSQKRQNVGVALANVDRLFNGIITDLQEREELKEYLNCFHKRQPISRSLKETYDILDEDRQQTGATIRIYVRLSYFGKSVITEIEKDCGLQQMFYAQEETNEKSPYQCRELKLSELESGCWGSNTFLPPVRADQLVCHCDKWSVGDETGTGNRRRDRESGESFEKRGRKSSGDHSQVSTSTKVKKTGGTSQKTEKPTRISKSADGKGRKDKPDSGKAARMSKTLETLEKNESDLATSRKQRTTSKDKRVRGDLRDRKTIEKPPIEEKPKKVDAGDSSKKTSNENTKLKEQLRKRCRGIVTVGLDDKKKNICQGTPRQSLICPIQDALTSLQLCTNLRYSAPCYYSQSYACSPRSLPLNHGCFIDSRTKQTEENLCTSFYRRNILEMQLVTN